MILEKIKKKVELGSIDIYDFDGTTLDEAIRLLEEMRDEQYENITIETETDFYDGEDGYATLLIYGRRMENDMELEARQNAHNKAELQKYLNEQEAIKKKKELFQQLKQEFEP